MGAFGRKIRIVLCLTTWTLILSGWRRGTPAGSSAIVAGHMCLPGGLCFVRWFGCPAGRRLSMRIARGCSGALVILSVVLKITG